MADRLTALDASFLGLEDVTSHMHVASVTIFEGPSPSYRELVEHIDSRLSLVPRFRQRLRFVPLNQGRPVWVDDPHFNLEYHVRVTALPPPGNEDQLKRLAGRVFSQQLDRMKPLWEIWLVQGLDRVQAGEGEGRFALLAKTHHALVDGVAGVDITAVLFDAAREPETPPAKEPDWVPRPEPTSVQLLGDALLERATRPAEMARFARAALRGPRRIVAGAYEALSAVGSFASSGLSAPPSPLNVDIGPHRRFDWVRADLSLVKQIKDELGGSVNDVVLAIVAGAMRRFLEERGEDVSELELRVMVPVSVRRSEEYGTTGNRVAAMMAPLPIYEADPVERLRIVRDAMAGLKESKQAIGAQILTELGGFAPPTVLTQAARLQARQRFFNMVVTNIPGPQMPLYVLGRELLDLIPMAPLARRQALCIAVMSYNGKLDFGLLADFDALPDIAAVGRGLEQSLDELRSAAGIEPPAAKVDHIPAADRAAAAQPNGGRPEPSAIGE